MLLVIVIIIFLIDSRNNTIQTLDIYTIPWKEVNRVLLYFDVNNDIVYGGMLISYNPVKAVVNEGVVFYKYVLKQ